MTDQRILKCLLGAIVLVLTACGGGGGGSSDGGNTSSPSQNVEIEAAGIKGPLAFADVNIYMLNTSLSELYDVSNPIASAVTNESARISGLSISREHTPPYIMTIGGPNAIDLNTGQPPVIPTLVTVITQEMLDNQQPIYATPLTTLVINMAAEDSDASTSAASFSGLVNSYSNDVAQIFSVNQDVNIDIFKSPAVFNGETTTAASQTEAAYHRAAIEAFSAKVHDLVSNDNNADTIIDQLARDLQSDGVIDNAANGAVIGDIDPSVVLADPLMLVIPNTLFSVSEIVALMQEEQVALGTSRDVTVSVPPVTRRNGEGFGGGSNSGSGGSGSGSSGSGSSGSGSSGSGSSGSGSFAPFANVPVLPGRMNFDWFEDAKAQYSSSVADDPMDWQAAYANASSTISISSCSQLQSTLDQVSPGTMILVDSGDYNECRVTIRRSGTANQPIIITAKAKALGTSGEVRFIGGHSFGNFENQASHYIIGGFSFIGQTHWAFRLERGAGSTSDPVYEDGSTDIRFTDSHFEGITRSRGSNDGVIDIGVRSHRIRVDHNSFISNYSQVRWRSRNADGSHVATSKDGRVDHNYFGPAATSGFLSGVPYEISALQSCCGNVPEDADELTLTIEYNVVEHPRTTNTDGEVFEIKSSGNIVRNNIMWASRGDISIRQGHGATVYSNYLVNVGISILGSNHVIRDNYIDGGSVLRHGISMFRWGRRQPGNCTILSRVNNNLITSNTILNTADYGMRIGDCDFGACRPITNSRIANNFISSNTGVLVHFNTNNEPGRSSVCDSSTVSRSSLFDQPGDADGGINTGIVFESNTYVANGSASYGSGFNLDSNAQIQ